VNNPIIDLETAASGHAWGAKNFSVHAVVELPHRPAWELGERL